MLRCLLFTLLSVLLSVTNLAYADKAFTKRADVQKFLNMMVKKHHFKKAALTKLFNQVKLRPKVIEYLNQPAEAKPWRTYQGLFITQRQITNGVKFWKKHAKILAKAEKKYGVPPSIIVATLGVETKYGANTGGYRVIDSLSSIGFSKSRRAGFFRKELAQFLLLTREQHLNPLKVTGSYAGAIGVPQFIPSSYRHYAVDFSNSGYSDLMNNNTDVIGSVANYYKRNGWEKNQPVATRANIVEKKYSKLKNSKKAKRGLPLKTLKKYGVTPRNKAPYNNRNAKVIDLSSKNHKEYWVGFHNFDVIKRYNASNLYAMVVYQLSNQIKDLKEHK